MTEYVNGVKSLENKIPLSEKQAELLEKQMEEMANAPRQEKEPA